MATEVSVPRSITTPTPTPTPEASVRDRKCTVTGTRRTALAITRLARQAELAFTEADLTLSQYRVLAILEEGCEASSKLAEKLAVSRPSVTGVVDGLVARGLVRRNPGDHDRRRIDLDLTEPGRAALIAADAAFERRIDRINELAHELRA